MIEKKPYSGFIRIRVAGFYQENDRILLVKLRSPITGKDVWIPPGGGVEFKEGLEVALIREFEEEANLKVNVEKLRHIHEFIEDEFHVMEFFFDVRKLEGNPKLGYDPERDSDDQLLTEIGFFTKDQIQEMPVKPDFLKNEFWNGNSSNSFLSNREGKMKDTSRT